MIMRQIFAGEYGSDVHLRVELELTARMPHTCQTRVACVLREFVATAIYQPLVEGVKAACETTPTHGGKTEILESKKRYIEHFETEYRIFVFTSFDCDAMAIDALVNRCTQQLSDVHPLLVRLCADAESPDTVEQLLELTRQ